MSSPTFLTFFLPVAFLAAGIFTVLQSPPSWFTYADPGYQYLLNGPSILVGSGTGHTDHPGTSMQILTGALSLILHLATRNNMTIQENIVTNAEQFSTFSILILILLQSLALWFTGTRLARYLGIGSAIIFQAAILGTTALTFFRTKLIPESLVIVCAILLIGLLAPNLLKFEKMKNPKLAFVVGIVLGIGVMAKVIFIPLVLLPLVILKLPDLIRVFIAFFASVGIILFFARDQISYMVDWFSAVSSTTARYPDEVEPENWYANLQTLPTALVNLYPIWLAAFFILLLVFIFIRPQIPKRTIIAFLLPSLFTFLMMYKSFRVNDLLVLAALSGMGLAVSWYYFSPRLRHKLSWLHKGLPTVAGVLSAVILINSSVVTSAAGSGHLQSTEMATKLPQLTAEGIHVAFGYGVFTPETALYYANQTSKDYALDEIVSSFPNWIDYNIWNSMFYGFNSEFRYWMPCQELSGIVDSPQGLLWVPGRDLVPTMPNDQYLLMKYSPIDQVGQFTVYKVNKIICRE